jgi:dolichol-phosphate mannosyltransferase
MYGDAIRTGISASRGRYVILMDADGSHDPGFLGELWTHRDTSDVVIASRYIKGGRTENPAMLILMSLAVNVIFRLVLGLSCRDVSNSFRLYQGEPLRKLKLECNNFDIVEEILVTLSVSKPDFKISEVPFTFGQRRAGKTKRKLLPFVFSYIVVLYRLYRLKAKISTNARKR